MKMKVLMVNKFLYPNGGSETYMFNLGNYLVSQGHEVQYFGMEHEGRIVGNRVNAYTSDMDFHGGSKLSKLMYPIKTIYSSEARKQIRKVLEDFQPDVVHLNNFNYQLTPSVILEIVKWRKDSKRVCRVIYTAHDYQLICPNHMINNPNTKENCEKCIGGNYLNCVKGKCIHGSSTKSLVGAMEGFYWNTRKTYKYIDKVVCISYFEESRIKRNKNLAGKTCVLYNYSSISRPNHYPEKKNYVLYFGRFSEEKGFRTFVEACKELPDIQFVIAGGGPLVNIIKDTQNIENKGFQSGEELQALIAEAKFAVVPSEWNEPFGLTIIEAQSLGTPVIGARIGAISELIDEDKNGLLFESHNVDELVKKIRELWEDKERLEVYINGCKSTNVVSIQDYYKRLMKIYEN